jgi:uncharacterized membrane protein
MPVLKSKDHEDPLKNNKPAATIKKTNALKTSNTRRTALIATLAALCIGTNYAMLPLPNVNLMDAIVFTTSLFFGVIPGAAVATISWLVYGTLNPFGLSLPVLITVIISESIYVVAGYLVRKTSSKSPKSNFKGLERNIIYGTAGLFATLAYDLITNAIVGLVVYKSVWIGLLTMNVPIPLGIIHEASNFFFFATVVPILVRVLEKTQSTQDGIWR